MKKLYMLTAALCAMFSMSFVANAQEDESGWEMTVGVENMSAYNWRGVRQSVNPVGYTLMPNVCVDWTVNDLCVEVGVYDIEEVACGDRFMELGAWVYLSAFNFDLQLQTYGLDTYLWNSSADYRAVYEAGLSYTLPCFEKFQPKFSWYTLVAGDDYGYDLAADDYTDKRAFSSYAELTLPVTFGDNLEVAGVIGVNPFQSPYYCYLENRFTVSNLGLSATYTFDFDNGISIPIKAEAGLNPIAKWSEVSAEEMNNSNGLYFGLTASFYFTKSLGK